MLVEGRMWGLVVGCLVDTGATVNILSLAWWRRHGEQGGASPTTEKVYSVEGRLMQLHGHVETYVELGGTRWPVGFELADIPTEAILGSDFLRTSTYLVDLAGERLILPPKQEGKGGREACRIVSYRTAVVAPGEETLVDGYIVGKWENGNQGLVEGIREVEERRGFLVGRGLIEPGQNEAPVRIYNPGQDPVILYRDMALATVEEVEEMEESENGGEGGKHHCRSVSKEPGVDREVEAVIQKLTEGVEEVHRPALEELLRRHQNAFQLRPGDKGRATMVEHRIKTGDHPPIKQAPRRLAPHRRRLVDEEVDKMLEGGVIEPATGPWAAPVVLVKKKDGTMRFCVDYRRLNSATIKDAYPLPRIDDSLDTLGGSRWFSTMDLVSGYWQVAMAPEDREKTAFSTHRGLFQFTVMPFGLCNAPGTFERLMEVAMRGLQWTSCLVYLDDIVVFSRDFGDHLERLGEVLTRLTDAGLKVKPSKCTLARKKVAFLGHVVSEEGVATDPAKVEAVRTWPVPETLTEVRSFLGLAGYYRAFVPDFATLAKPLSTLADKGRAFVWTEECREAFDGLKDLLTKSPILGYPADEGQIILDTDASDRGLGAVLSQTQEGREVVLSYASRTLTRPERNYCVTRRELLAIIFGLRKFRHYLLGRHVLIRTDHAALKWVMAFREPEGQVARWLQVLDTYDYKVEHRAGKQHGNADGLSRIPCRQCGRVDPGGEDITPPVVRVITRQGAQDPRIALGVREEWIHDQEEDPLLGRVHQWIREGGAPSSTEVAGEGYPVKCLVSQFARLEVREGLLGRWWVTPGTPRIFQVLVPDKRKEEAWETAHGGGIVGHFGRHRTLRKLQERWYWPEFRRDATYWTATCPRCLERKPPPHPSRAKMGHIPAGLPMERMAVDVMGPLPATVRGNKYIVVMMDYFSKWMEAVALPNQEAATVAQALVEGVVCRFGAPATLHSDQGRNFQSRLFREVVRILGITQTRTCAFNPQSDGMVERANRTIEALLAAVVSKDHSDWDLQLPMVAAAYRSSVHATTGVTPNMMMLGRETNPPLTLVYPQGEDMVGDEAQGYVAQLQRNMARAYQHARETIGVAVQRQMRNHDVHATDRSIAIGSLVYYLWPGKKKGLSPKLQSLWTGPWTVAERIGTAVYQIKRDKSAPRVVHFQALKVIPPPPQGMSPRETTHPPPDEDSQTPPPKEGPPILLAPARRVRQVLQSPTAPGWGEGESKGREEGKEEEGNKGILQTWKPGRAVQGRAVQDRAVRAIWRYRWCPERATSGQAALTLEEAMEGRRAALKDKMVYQPEKAPGFTKTKKGKTKKRVKKPRKSKGAIASEVGGGGEPENHRGIDRAYPQGREQPRYGAVQKGGDARSQEQREEHAARPRAPRDDNNKSYRTPRPAYRSRSRENKDYRGATATNPGEEKCLHGVAMTARGTKYACGLCELVFVQKSSRTRHVETAHSEQRTGWLCPQSTTDACEYATGRPSDMRRHLEALHPQVALTHAWMRSWDAFPAKYPIPHPKSRTPGTPGTPSTPAAGGSSRRRGKAKEKEDSSSPSSSSGESSEGETESSSSSSSDDDPDNGPTPPPESESTASPRTSRQPRTGKSPSPRGGKGGPKKGRRGETTPARATSPHPAPKKGRRGETTPARSTSPHPAKASGSGTPAPARAPGNGTPASKRKREAPNTGRVRTKAERKAPPPAQSTSSTPVPKRGRKGLVAPSKLADSLGSTPDICLGSPTEAPRSAERRSTSGASYAPLPAATQRQRDELLPAGSPSVRIVLRRDEVPQDRRVVVPRDMTAATSHPPTGTAQLTTQEDEANPDPDLTTASDMQAAALRTTALMASFVRLAIDPQERATRLETVRRLAEVSGGALQLVGSPFSDAGSRSTSPPPDATALQETEEEETVSYEHIYVSGGEEEQKPEGQAVAVPEESGPDTRAAAPGTPLPSLQGDIDPAGGPVLNQEEPAGEPVQEQPHPTHDTPSVHTLLDPSAPPLSLQPELLHEIFRAWDFQHPVVLTPGGTLEGAWDGTLTAEVPAEDAPGTEITFTPRAPGTPLVVRQRPAPPPEQLSDQEKAALEGVGGDLPGIPLSLSDEEGGKLPKEWQSPPPVTSKVKTTAPKREAEPQPSTSGGKAARKDSRPHASWGHLRSAHDYQRLAEAKARTATQGPGSSFHRTPPSAGGRGRRFAPNAPAGKDKAHSPHPLGPTPHQVVWLPWWVVSGREPNTMERWAAFLLPPLDMGEQFSTSGGEVDARLIDHGDYSYSVVASVTTRYTLSRREAERASRHAAGQGAARDPQDLDQDQVSTLVHLKNKSKSRWAREYE